MIHNVFATHGEELDQHNLINRKAIIYFIAVADGRGAFDRPEQIDEFIKKVKKLTNNQQDVIVVCGPWSSLHRVIAWQRRLRNERTISYYNQEPWITNLIIWQHGQPLETRADKSGPYKYIGPELLKVWQKKWQNKKIHSDLMPDAKIILRSCSTGDDSQTAMIDYYAQVTQRETTGPTKPAMSSLKSL